MKYFGSRYGTPVAAKAFWERNHYYFGGGRVNPATLFDQGGLLKPGMTPVMNLTGRTEHVYTDRDNHIIASALEDRSGAPIQIDVHGNMTERTARMLVHDLDLAKRKERAMSRARMAARG